jgi:hypothetical protein
MTISYAEIPYFQTDDDKKACLLSGERMVAALKAQPDITLVKPASNQTVMEYVNSVSPPLLAGSGSFQCPATAPSSMCENETE